MKILINNEMKIEHNLVCEAPICCADSNKSYKNEVVWFAGEAICKKVPYQKFQMVQKEINKSYKKGRFKKVDQAYTAHDIETRSL